MALWQLVLHLIPSSAAESGGTIASWMDPERLDAIDLDLSPSASRTLVGRLCAILPESKDSTPDHWIWGDDKTDDIQAGLEGEALRWLQFRLDAGNASPPLVERICALTRENDCVLATDSGIIVRPCAQALDRVIRSSDAARYAADPARTSARPRRATPS